MEETRWVIQIGPSLINSYIRKKKVTYTMPDEVKAPKSQAQPLIITDMTRETPRVVSAISDLYQEQQQQPLANYLPELQHNVKLLLDMKESDVLLAQRKLAQEKEHLTRLSQRKEDLTHMVRSKLILDAYHLQQVAQEDQMVSRLKELVEIIDKTTEKVTTKQITLDNLAKVFALFQVDSHLLLFS
jgi:hypothetical protein